ncbi:hypothetical protein TNCT_559351 [Trichonephila clavata]|uniref:Uncharacterized protein n=1 Tax=Trichonephila clavata TaxID=2740835 RepID=A0A8X6H243_TRICU|nr:hypothetical protein TNCT_559351 [Trichonephila clavata]
MGGIVVMSSNSMTRSTLIQKRKHNLQAKQRIDFLVISDSPCAGSTVTLKALLIYLDALDCKQTSVDGFPIHDLAYLKAHHV